MKDTELTKGPIFKELIRFSLPMIAGNMLQQVYNFADALIVGRCISADALAAVGSAYTLMVFISSVIIGLCMGSGAFFSADYGAGNGAQLKEDIRLSFRFILAVSVALELMVLRIEGAMYVGIGVLFLWYGYFRGVGRPHISLILTVISLGTRVVLSYALAPNTPLGVTAIWLSIPIGWLLADIAGIVFYHGKKRT